MADADSTPPQHALDECVARDSNHQRIIEGSLPSTLDLLAGAPWYGNDIRRDMTVWCDSLLLSRPVMSGFQKIMDEKEPGIDVRAVLQNLRDVGNRDSLLMVELVLETCGQTETTRMLCYRACQDDDDEAARLALIKEMQRESYDRDGYDNLWTSAVALGLAFNYRKSMYEYCRSGMRMIASDSKPLQSYFDAERYYRNGMHLKAAAQEIAEDAVGILPDPIDDEDEEEGPSLVAVPKLPEGGTGHRKEIAKSWKGLDGERLPIITRGDIAARRRSLVERWPHAVEAIDTILGDLAAREEVRFRPTLLVGPPGAGKSSLARAICDAFELPCQLYSVPTAADSSLAGTSAQWSTAREAIPLQLIKQHRLASVAVIWDEIEKAPSGDHNGSALAALLPLLEIDQARRFRDLCLEVECDLSMVSNFATANSTSGIPAPLRDRMRILHVPEPTWQHLGALTGQIIGRIAQERGVDPRWFAPLAEDEFDLVRRAWPGGSMRQLTRIVTTLVDGREQLMGRC